ncbi:Conserved_hypothetical protein [Hexamita inflata]|uniref:Uncharacterized protein n=1 Tax=Hexamita inflata TaxID=28002 RepID=A0AA86PJY0_9EUKA|nr:Conserved hypothetical protein [Hexamita inflata]
MNLSLLDTQNDVKQQKYDISVLRTNISTLDANVYDLNQSVSQFKLNLSQLIDIQNQYQDQLNKMKDIIMILNCSNNIGYQFINGSCVLLNCQITGQQRVNGSCQCINVNEIVENDSCVCPQYSNLIGSVCTCPLYSSLINGVCICDQIIGQIIELNQCTCPAGQSIINGVCKSVVVINGSDSSLQCTQSIYITTFDIKTVTHQIQTQNNFSSGYVFGASTTVQMAFIDVSDNVYPTVKPLFQSQQIFNNLKVQFGVQTLNTGSLILSSSSSITINSMNLISKSGSQLTVNNALSQLNIITSSSSSADINKLLVNLSFTVSSGNITLINNINGIFNITEYLVLGDYMSTQIVSMIAININATVNANLISFKPNTYNVGNSSSYLFANVVSSACILEINNFAVVLGNNSNSLLLGSISSTQSNYYLFGGIIAYINIMTTITIYNIIIDSYQQCNTSYILNSGILIGYLLSNISSIAINSVCLQQKITSTSIQVQYFGLIGQVSSKNISFQNSSITIYVQTQFMYCFGIIGALTNSLYGEVINLRTSVSTNYSSGSKFGSIIGFEAASNYIVQNSSIIRGTIESGSSSYIGGFIGIIYTNSIAQIQNSEIQKTNISGTYIGGFVGESLAYFNLKNSKILFVRFTGPTVGILMGQNSGLNNIMTNSTSSSNHINNVQQKDCSVLSNVYTGC